MKIEFQKQFGKGSDPLYAKAERWVKKKFKNPYIQHLALGIVAWLNINGHNCYNIKHDHPTANLSGVLWIKCPKECGNILFESPVEFQTYTEVKSYTKEFKNSNNYFHTYYFLPIEGRMLVFPSHLQHEVLENKSNEDRISVSFNIDLINEN